MANFYKYHPLVYNFTQWVVCRKVHLHETIDSNKLKLFLFHQILMQNKESMLLFFYKS